MRVRFGDCRFDSESYELMRAGQRLPLTPKAFELLTALLESRPRAVTKAELHDWLWPETFVGRTSLARLINEVRKAIGDDAREPRLLRTVSRIGYAFSGEVVEVRESRTSTSLPRWCLFWNGHETPLVEGENALGRGFNSIVRIPSCKVSRRHARILVDDDAARLEDLGSKNGTFLHDERITSAVTLNDGDEIRLGPALLVFHTTSGSALITTDRAEAATGFPSPAAPPPRPMPAAPSH